MTSAPTPARHDVRAGVAVRSAGIAVAVGLAFGPAVALGLARFAYALLLPAMRDDLHWSFAAAGAMNTTNAIGYLAAPMARWGGTRAMFVGGLCVTAAALLACAATTNLAALRVARTLAVPRKRAASSSAAAWPPGPEPAARNALDCEHEDFTQCGHFQAMVAERIGVEPPVHVPV